MWQIIREEEHKTKLVLLKEILWLSKAQTNAEKKHLHKNVN